MSDIKPMQPPACEGNAPAAATAPAATSAQVASAADVLACRGAGHAAMAPAQVELAAEPVGAAPNALDAPDTADVPYEHDVSAARGEGEGPAAGEAKELSFEEKVERASTLVSHNPAYRRVFMKIIAACVESARPLPDLEQFVAEQPGYAKLKQPPYYPIEWLHQNFALEELYLDAQGALHAQADVAGLSEDEFDDLVAVYAYRTTDVGFRVAELFDPARKLAELLQEEADRCDVYVDLLDFLREKHPFAHIEGLLRNRPELKETSRDGVALQPSMFVDKLEAIGAIDFDGGWHITDEGRELLDSLN